MQFMKKKISILIALLIVVVILLIVILFLKKDTYTISLGDRKDCGDPSYYFDYEGRTVYLDCFQRIFIEINGEKYDLNDAIHRNLITFSDLWNKSSRKLAYWDGGTTLYQYDEFSIIAYQRMQDNGEYCDDIIIGSSEMKVEDYCK